MRLKWCDAKTGEKLFFDACSKHTERITNCIRIVSFVFYIEAVDFILCHFEWPFLLLLLLLAGGFFSLFYIRRCSSFLYIHLIFDCGFEAFFPLRSSHSHSHSRSAWCSPFAFRLILTHSPKCGIIVTVVVQCCKDFNHKITDVWCVHVTQPTGNPVAKWIPVAKCWNAF